MLMDKWVKTAQDIPIKKTTTPPSN